MGKTESAPLPHTEDALRGWPPTIVFGESAPATPDAPPSWTPTLNELRCGPPTISVERAGRYLGVSRAYAYQMAREGRLPTIQLGARRIRVKTAALLRLLGDDA